MGIRAEPPSATGDETPQIERDGEELPRMSSGVGCDSTAHGLKSQVVLLQTAQSWANAGVLLGARMHRERGSFRSN